MNNPAIRAAADENGNIPAISEFADLADLEAFLVAHRGHIENESVITEYVEHVRQVESA